MQARKVSLSGHETKSRARGILLFAHRKRRELAAHFLNPFSKESNFQGIQGSMVLAA